MAHPRRRYAFLGLFIFVALWALPGSSQKGARVEEAAAGKK